MCCNTHTFPVWIKNFEVNNEVGPEQKTSDIEKIKGLEKELHELKQANEIPGKASTFFAQAGFRLQAKTVISFIDTHKNQYGVGPICKMLPIAPSAYSRELKLRKEPELHSKRHHRDSWLEVEIRRVYNENRCVYGAPKIWQQLKREGYVVARCRIKHLMKRSVSEGLSGEKLFGQFGLFNGE